VHKVAILGSGNIGTDLLIKVLRHSRSLEMAAMAGVDSTSEGLARAKRMHVPITDGGLEGLMRMKEFEAIKVVFDATSAKAHLENAEALKGCGKKLIDLTPAALGP
jgi:acetaldehyde dehydrogenase